LPDLPVWALPQVMRGKASGKGSAKNGTRRDSCQPVGNGHGGNGNDGAGRGGNGRNHTLNEIETLSKQVGRGIVRNIVVTVAGVGDAAHVSDAGKLQEIADRLGNASRGIQRLRAAVGKVGLEALAAACRELKLSSTLTEDIPDTKVLRQLVDRLEQQAEALAPIKPGFGATAKKETDTGGTHGTTSATDFVGMRNEVLTLARRLASSSKRPIADVMTWASDGAFQYADIGKLSSADVPKLQVAVRRLREAANEAQS
jgi:hypothetical protein